MDPIISRIEDLILTKSETKIADYMTDGLDTIGLLTARELAEAAGVSDTSVIRFVRKLGFSTYAQFRDEMNARITQSFVGAKPGAEVRTASQKMVGSLSESILLNMNKAFTRLDDSTVRKIVEILRSSEHKYIAGFHTTAGCAQYMATRLVQLLPHVIPLVNADASSVETILDIGPRDCLLVYTFLKHSRINAPLMKLAKQNGARIVLITDKASSPLIRKADITLITQIRGDQMAYSYVAPLAVSEILLMTLIDSSGSDGEQRMHRLEALLDNADLF